MEPAASFRSFRISVSIPGKSWASISSLSFRRLRPLLQVFLAGREAGKLLLILRGHDLFLIRGQSAPPSPSIDG